MSNGVNRRLRYDVVIIGGGQAGLAMGYELQKTGLRFVIIDASRNIGDSWMSRWDSLTLFTPAKYSSLPGLPFPAAPAHLPTRVEVAKYLDAYARAYSLPVALDEPVRHVRAAAQGGYHVVTDYACYCTKQLVIATGGYQSPYIPPVSASLSESVVQLHSHSYRNPSQLTSGPVLVVGAGNSGVQIAQELSFTHDVTIAAGASLLRLPERFLGRSIFSYLYASGAMNVTVHSFLGARASRREVLIGESARSIARKHGVRVASRITRAEGRVLVSRTGERIAPASVIWATGYRPSYGWLDVAVLDGAGRPVHTRGVTSARGIYFLGLPWQHTRGSSLIGGVGRDAAYIASRIRTFQESM